jgi:Arc/MetJ-type ribon-helix-helix transcriptional regulator
VRITIELSPEVEKWLSAKVQAGAISSADEFVSATVTRDFLEEQLEESLREPASPLTPGDWDSARKRLQDRVSAKNEDR